MNANERTSHDPLWTHTPVTVNFRDATIPMHNKRSEWVFPESVTGETAGDAIHVAGEIYSLSGPAWRNRHSETLHWWSSSVWRPLLFAFLPASVVLFIPFFTYRFFFFFCHCFFFAIFYLSFFFFSRLPFLCTFRSVIYFCPFLSSPIFFVLFAFLFLSLCCCFFVLFFFLLFFSPSFNLFNASAFLLFTNDLIHH